MFLIHLRVSERVVQPPVILWYEPENAPARVSSNDFTRICHTLGAVGLERVSCHNASQLLSKAERVGQRYEQGAVARGWMLAVLCSGLAENAALAHLLRAGQPSMGVVACVPDLAEETQLLALQSGIDAWFAPEASGHLVVAIIFSLLRRMGGVEPTVLPGIVSTGWQLVENAWKLKLPSGTQVALTTTERAFMLALAASEGRNATHEQLAVAMGLAEGRLDPEARRERLSVLVSRLRRKVLAVGANLPVRSVHGKGYLFNDEMS